MTADHSLAEEKVRQGELTEAEAAVHPHRHILTRALGRLLRRRRRPVGAAPARRRPDPPLQRRADQRGRDRVRSATCWRSVRRSRRCRPRSLVRAANEHGGNDNITVVVVDVLVGEPGREPLRRCDRPAWSEDGAGAGIVVRGRRPRPVPPRRSSAMPPRPATEPIGLGRPASCPHSRRPPPDARRRQGPPGASRPTRVPSGAVPEPDPPSGRWRSDGGSRRPRPEAPERSSRRCATPQPGREASPGRHPPPDHLPGRPVLCPLDRRRPGGRVRLLTLVCQRRLVRDPGQQPPRDLPGPPRRHCCGSSPSSSTGPASPRATSCFIRIAALDQDVEEPLAPAARQLRRRTSSTST